MIYIYDRNEKQIAHLDIVPTITEEIGKLRTLEFESEEEFEKGYRVVANTVDGVFEFVIIDSDYSRDDVKVFSYFCQDSLIETQSIPILDKRPQGNVEVVSKAIFGDTRWVVEVRNGYNLSTVFKNSYYHITALEAFSEMVEKYRAEWITEFKVVGSEITERRVVLYQRDGKSKGRLEFGKNITKFERKILSEPIVTALYVHGKGEDLSNGTYGRRTNISSVNGGKEYIENVEATKKYGLGKSGQKKALFGFIIFEEETDPSNLLRLGKQELEILSQVRAEYTVNAINLDINARIGYEVAVIDEEIGYRGYSRIIKIVRQGDDIELTFGTVTKKFVDSVQKTLKKNEQNINNAFVEINNVRTSADGKTGVFTGPSQPNKANNGDWWYRYNPDGTVSMLIFKDGEWVDELTDRLFKDIRLKIEQAQQSADKASEDIEEKARVIQEEIKSTNADTIKQLEEYKTSNNKSVDVIKNDILGVNQKLDTKASIDEVQKDLSSFDEKLKTKADSTAVVEVRKTVDGIQGSIKETNAKVDGLQVGGRNLILDADKDVSNKNYYVREIKFTEPLAIGEYYTISIKGEVSQYSNGWYVNMNVVNAENKNTYPEIVRMNEKDKKANGWWSKTVKITNAFFGDGYEQKLKGFVYASPLNSSRKDDEITSIDKIKIEHGTFATDFTLAPEDMASQQNLNEFKRTAEGNFNKITEIQKDLSTGETFKKIQTIEQTANTNKATIALVKETADGAMQVTAFNEEKRTIDESISKFGKIADDNKTELSEFKKTAQGEFGRISSVEKRTGTLESGMDNVEARANQLEDELMNKVEISKFNDFSKTAEGNFQKLTEIETNLTTGETFQKIQSIEETANGNKRTIALVGENVNQFNQSISEVNLELSRIGKKTAGTDALYNELKRTVDETSSIISDPTRKDLLSAINQKAGQVLIQAGDTDGKSRLMVTKDSTFIDKAVIQNAHIADGAIDTVKIKDASVTSAKIISLDVDKINGNVSNFVQSYWNSINSSVRIDGNGLYIDGSWGGAINFTSRGLTYYDKIKGQVMGYSYGLYRNPDDPRVNDLMQGVFLGAELGYNLKLGIRTEIYNQNTTFLEINGVDKYSTKGTIFGELDLKSNLILNENSIIIKGSSGVKFGVGQILGNTVTYMVNVQGTAGIGFTMGGGIVVRRYDSGAGAPIWKWL